MTRNVKPLRVNLDWQAYYQRFKEIHGDPVSFKGRLLFPDGWGYSIKDVKGPEWPPPIDKEELRQLQISYWQIRLALVTRERDSLQETVIQLKEMQYIRSAPLQNRVSVYDDEKARYTMLRQDIDIKALEQGRLKWLEEDIQECEKKLEELEVTDARSSQRTPQ